MWQRLVNDPGFVGLLSLVGVVIGQVIARVTAPSVRYDPPRIHNTTPPTTAELEHTHQ